MTGPQFHDKSKAEAQAPSPYERWRQLAVGLLRRERQNHTLGPTELVHEAWLRTQANAGAQQEIGEGLARRAMQNALVDHARARGAAKRAAGRTEEWNEDASMPDAVHSLDPFQLAFERLGSLDPELTKLLRLRFEEGLSVEDTAERLGLSSRTVKRETRAARAWLRQFLGGLDA